LVVEKEGEVLGTGAVMLDFGDHHDQIGEMGRLVVHPERAGSELGKRIMDELFAATGENV
jgi:N-acetylglutamate synthase-like GNAT family acetyltransferase